MKSYNVTITEILEKTVTVEAESADEAEEIVKDAWKSEEYILDSDDFKGVSFEAR